MKFGISQEGNFGVEKSGWIQEISDSLEKYFDGLNYGEDLKTLTIGVVCVKPEFDFFFKERKPKYYAGKKSITHDGFTIEVENLLEFDIKLDYDKMVNLDKQEFIREISNALINSIDKIIDVKRIKDFQIEKFREDLTNCGALAI